jgi:hypothetical protein
MVVIGPTGIGDNPLIAPGGPAAVIASTVAGPVKSVGEFLGLLSKGATWLRILLVVGGGILMFIGLSVLLKQTEIGGAAISAVTKGAV